MSSNALFGSTSTRNQQKHLVEFKAGKMNLRNNTMHPDKRKGLVYVYQSDDSLMHFCWKDRQTGTVEDDLIIFPDDCEFKKIPQCTTGRVYVLKFKSSTRKFFFWIQDLKTDKDEENCKKVNDVLNNPPTPGSSRGGNASSEGELHNLLNNMSQQQLMQLFGNVGNVGNISSLLGTMNRPTATSGTSRTSTTAPKSSSVTTKPKPSTSGSVTRTAGSTAAVTTTGASAASSSSTAVPPNPIQLSDLQNLLSGLNVPDKVTASAPVSADLSSVMTPEAMQSILKNPEIVRELQKHIPPAEPGQNESERLRATILSPQFQQAVRTFSSAFKTGELGPVVQQFDVGSEAVTAANQGNMEEFIKALQNASISNTSERCSSESPKQPEKRKKCDDSDVETAKKKDKDDENAAT